MVVVLSAFLVQQFKVHFWNVSETHHYLLLILGIILRSGA